MSQYTEEIEGPGWVGLAEVAAPVKQVEGDELQTRLINNGTVLQIHGRVTIKAAEKIGAGALMCKIAKNHALKHRSVFAAGVNSTQIPFELKVNTELVPLVEIKAEEEVKIAVLIPAG